MNRTLLIVALLVATAALAADTPQPSFRWPVEGRKIVARYGERTNPTTKTVTVNPGINIAAKRGDPVRAAASGKVSLVTWLPGYATLVIVEHAGGYRTVYANLGTATVARGARVKSGARIGRVGRTGAGEFLHFEVWRKQAHLDPLTVLP